MNLPRKRERPRRRQHPIRPPWETPEKAPQPVDPLAWRDRKMALDAAAIARTPGGRGDCMATGCPACPPGPHRGTVAHHIHQVSLGGTDHPLNLLWICGWPGASHDWIHDNIAAAYQQGWLASFSLPWPEPDEPDTL